MAAVATMVAAAVSDWDDSVRRTLEAIRPRLEELMMKSNPLVEHLDEERRRFRAEHPWRYRVGHALGWLRYKRRLVHNWHDRYCQRMGWTQ